MHSTSPALFSFSVDSEGCAAAVKRILGKIDGKSFQPDIACFKEEDDHSK